MSVTEKKQKRNQGKVGQGMMQCSACKQLQLANNLQGAPLGQRISFIAIDLAVPFSIQFCLDSWKSGSIGLAPQQNGGTLISKATK